MCRCCNWAFPDKTSLHVHVQNMQVLLSELNNSGDMTFSQQSHGRHSMAGAPARTIKCSTLPSDIGARAPPDLKQSALFTSLQQQQQAQGSPVSGRVYTKIVYSTNTASQRAAGTVEMAQSTTGDESARSALRCTASA